MGHTISIEELQGAAMFRQLTGKDAEAAMDDITQVHLVAGETLFRQGDEGDSIFFVVSGQLNVVLDVPTGGERVVGKLGPNSILGEMSLLLNMPRTATVTAATKAELWKVARSDFEESIAWNERWASQFLFLMAQTLASRLAGMNNEIVSMVTLRQKDERAVQWQQLGELRRHLYTVLEANEFRGLDANEPSGA